MSDPWQILALSRTEATEKDVKIAYAKLIKVHRPDSDPEGFQRVRTAYEQALQQLRDGFDDDQPLTWVSNPEDLPDDPIESLPYEVTQAADHLREVVRIKNRGGVESVLWELYHATRQAQVPGHLVGTLVLQIFGDELPFWITSVPMEFIFDLVLLGDIQFAHAAFESWWKVGAFARGQELAEKLLHAAPTMVGEEMGLILAAAGIYCGFWFPQLAHDLGQAAYKLISNEARDNVLQQLDQQVMLGRLFEAIPFEQRVFWRERLRSPDLNAWNTEKGKEVLSAALRFQGAQWPAWGLVRDQIPGWVRSRLQERQNAAAGQRHRTTDSSARFAWLLVPILIAVFRFIASVGQSSPTFHPVSDFDRSRIELSDLQRNHVPPRLQINPRLTPPWPTGVPGSSSQPNSITAPFNNPLVTPPTTTQPLPPPSSGSSGQVPDLSHWQNPRH